MVLHNGDRPVTIGLDIGTTNIKGSAFTLDGRAVASASVPTVTHSPRPGWSSHDAEELWSAAVTVIRRIVAQLDHPERIAGIAVAGMAEAGVLLDDRGAALGEIIAWFDPRTLPQMEGLVERAGEERIVRITGQRPQPIFSLNKILWLREHAPEQFRRARRWLQIADFIAFRLCGVPVTDWSLASRTMAFDLAELRWSDELLDLAGIDPSLFAPAVQSGARIGSVTAAAAAETGLPVGCAVASGGHDHLCGALAAGATAPGAMLDSLGTAEALLICLARPIDDRRYLEAGYTQGAHVAPGSYYVNGTVRSSGKAVNWLRDLVGADVPIETLIAEASAVPVGAYGAMFLPHLVFGDPPHPDTRSRGALIGLSAAHDRGAIARAVFEGLAFEARAGFDPLLRLGGRTGFPPITAIGGGARNELLLKIKASVLNATYRVIDVPEASALGAATLAAIGAGLFNDVADALRSHRHEVRSIEPEPAWVEPYDRLYRDVFSHLYDATRELHHRLYAFANPELRP